MYLQTLWENPGDAYMFDVEMLAVGVDVNLWLTRLRVLRWCHHDRAVVTSLRRCDVDLSRYYLRDLPWLQLFCVSALTCD